MKFCNKNFPNKWKKQYWYIGISQIILALHNAINANEQQKSLKRKAEDISGFETQVKRKPFNKWDAKLKALNDSEDQRKKEIEKFVSIIFYWVSLSQRVDCCAGLIILGFYFNSKSHRPKYPSEDINAH